MEQHRTEHILVVTSTFILPGSPPHQGKSDFSGTHFIRFRTYGNIGPNPTHLSAYHSEENKAPYVHSQKKKKSGFPGGSVSKESTCNVGDLGSIPGLGRSPREGNSYLLQYSCLENPYGQRRLAGYSPWGGKEWDTTEHSTA